MGVFFSYLPNTFGIETHIFELFKLALPPTANKHGTTR